MRHPVPLTIDRPALVSAVLVRVPAGFPSPAQDSFDDGRIDLNEVLIRDVTSTYLFRVTGDSMEGIGIYSGDEVLVDRSLTPRHGDVVIAAITSCTNTSNPSVMIGAALLAKKAVEKGLTRKPWVKSSLAPGSRR